jgi:hypothetical protein
MVAGNKSVINVVVLVLCWVVTLVGRTLLSSRAGRGSGPAHIPGCASATLTRRGPASREWHHAGMRTIHPTLDYSTKAQVITRACRGESHESTVSSARCVPCMRNCSLRCTRLCRVHESWIRRQVWGILSGIVGAPTMLIYGLHVGRRAGDRPDFRRQLLAVGAGTAAVGSRSGVFS